MTALREVIIVYTCERCELMQATGCWPDVKTCLFTFLLVRNCRSEKYKPRNTPSSAHVCVCVCVYVYVYVYVYIYIYIYIYIFVWITQLRFTPIYFLCGAHVCSDRRLVSACWWLLQPNVFTRFWRKDYSLRKLQAVDNNSYRKGRRKALLLQAFTEREKCWRAEKDLESWNEREVGEEEGNDWKIVVWRHLLRKWSTDKC